MAYNLLEKVYRTQTSPIQTFLFNVGRSSLSLTLDCKTVRIFAYSSTRASRQTKGLEWGWKQGARLGRDAKNTVFFLSPHTPFGRVRLARFARVRLLRHPLPISLLILRKKPTVLQSTLTYGPQSIQYRLCLHTPGLYSPQTLSHFTQRVLNSMHCKSVIAEAPYLTWNPSEKFW